MKSKCCFLLYEITQIRSAAEKAPSQKTAILRQSKATNYRLSVFLNDIQRAFCIFFILGIIPNDDFGA